MNEIANLIEKNHQNLNNSEKHIANIILNEQDKIANFNISELAKYCSVSTTTIYRFVKKMNIQSFFEFRIILNQKYEKTAERLYGGISEKDSSRKIREEFVKTIQSTIEMSNNIITKDEIYTFINLVKHSNRISTFGIGSSGIISQLFVMKFQKLGLNIMSNIDIHIQSSLLGSFGENDLLILFSNFGKTPEVLKAAKIAQKNNTKIIVISQDISGILNKYATLFIKSCSFENKIRLSAITSELSQLFIVDMLFILFVYSDYDKYIKTIGEARLLIEKYII